METDFNGNVKIKKSLLWNRYGFETTVNNGKIIKITPIRDIEESVIGEDILGSKPIIDEEACHAQSHGPWLFNKYGFNVTINGGKVINIIPIEGG